MTAISRPLRAAAVVVGSWVLVRAAMLIGTAPVAVSPVAVSTVAPKSRSAPPDAARSRDFVREPAPSASLTPPDGAWIPVVAVMQTVVLSRPAVSLRIDSGSPSSNAAPTGPAQRFEHPPEIPAPRVPDRTAASPLAALPPPPAPNRFQLSIWSLVRDAPNTGALAPGGTLGGSQVGARAWFDPGPKGLALTARLSSPLASRFGNEASLGFGLRKGNFGVIVEERFSLDAGGGARPSVTAFGGVSELRLRGKLQLDAYAQAGIVGLRNRVGFADGAVRIEHPVIGKTAGFSVGAGVWGGAQPGLARLDVGPQLVGRLPVFGGTLRIAGEWRFRVAGRADPGSGPTLSIGGDF